MRIGTHVQDYLFGQDLPQHRYPSPDQVMGTWTALAQKVRSPTPFPPGLSAAHAQELAKDGPLLTAAEHGRGGL